jgi:hypothetical protein
MFPLGAVLSIGETAICSVCTEQKQLENFRIRTDTGKYRPFCFCCESKIRKDTYLATRKYRLEKAQNRREKNPVQKILKQAKATADSKNLEFNLTEEDIVLPETCKYLGSVLTNVQGQGVVWENYSIDRIDSSKGYVKGNVEIISRKANSMKNMATKDELITFAKNILRIYGE